MQKGSTMNREITLTPEGGRFYRAMAFHWVTVVLTMPLVFCVLLVAIVNPFWFRDSFFNWVERLVNRYTRWRNYVKYKIYLGTDPKMWHSLKGDLE
jgi:hypothetical protein